MDISVQAVQAHLLQRSRFGEQRKQPTSVTWSTGCMAPQAPTQAAQNIAQGDNATPLETGLRQRGNVESQRAAEAKAARDTALAAFNRERRQERLRTAQELVDCLGSAWIC